jgi:hypothetical protein
MPRTGRPSSYKTEFAKQARNLCLLGATNEDLADFFDVAVSTVDLWIKEREDFSGSVKEGRVTADAKVARRLYERACGYSHPEERLFQVGDSYIRVDTVKHYPPDTAAAFIWLKNRRRGQWTDRTEQHHTGNVTVVVQSFSRLPAPKVIEGEVVDDESE